MSSSDNSEDKVREGHSYDGILEYDNPMPRWWVNLFWATVIFSIVYCAYYMTGIGPSHHEEYAEELRIAQLKFESQPAAVVSTDEIPIAQRLIAAAKNPDAVAAGKVVYDSKCMVCHADKGQGLIGPNLTDEFWIHGGSLEEMLHIVNVGVPAKGMIPWESQLSEEERINVVAFMRSIQDTKVPGKAREGEVSSPTEL